MKEVNQPWRLTSRAFFWATLWLGANIIFVEGFPFFYPNEWQGTRQLLWSANVTWFALIILFELKISAYLQGKVGSTFSAFPLVVRKLAKWSVIATILCLAVVVGCQFPMLVKEYGGDADIPTIQDYAFYACLTSALVVRATSFVYHVEAESRNL